MNRTFSQKLVTDGKATDGEKLFCSGIFCRISVLWRKIDSVDRSAMCCQYVENSYNFIESTLKLLENSSEN